MKTIMDLLMIAPDNAVEALQQAVREVSQGQWKAAANSVYDAGEMSDNPEFMEQCVFIGDMLWKKA